MTEPTTAIAASAVGAAKSAAGQAAIAKLIALLSLLGTGAVGALVMAAVDPPRSRRQLFLQAVVAGVTACYFAAAAARLLGAMEYELQIGFLIGALSWGAVGALVKLRTLIRDRAPDVIAAKAGLEKNA